MEVLASAQQLGVCIIFVIWGLQIRPPPRVLLGYIRRTDTSLHWGPSCPVDPVVLLLSATAALHIGARAKQVWGHLIHSCR